MNVLEIIISILFISLIGSAAHFAYDWSHHNRIVSIFTAVNESTWEHIKLALTATFVWSLYDAFIYGGTENYFIAKTASLVVMMSLIPLLFYTYRAILKKDFFVLDIIIFILAIVGGQLTFYFLINFVELGHLVNYLGAILLFVIFGIYLLATLMPLKNELFRDPITNKFGVRGHKK